MNKENLNKKIEETQKKFEKMFGGNCSYHEEGSWNGGKNGIFTIKFRKNIEILNGLEKEIADTDQQNRENEWKKRDAEWKRREEEWKRRESELGTPTNYNEKHSWRSWNNDGSIGTEGMYIKSENQSRLITLENNSNSPQIQEIDGKEREKVEENASATSEKQKGEQENKSFSQQNISQKTDNKDNNKNVYYGVGAISLVLLAISMVVVWVKKHR